jgi:hypothetical protein
MMNVAMHSASSSPTRTLAPPASSPALILFP